MCTAVAAPFPEYWVLIAAPAEWAHYYRLPNFSYAGDSSFAGLEVVKEMNRLGMLIDLSHCGDTTTMDAIRESEDPVAFTHANVRALCSSPRNKSDEQIVALAGKWGVI